MDGRMSDGSALIPVFRGGVPHIRKIGADRPWQWIAAGWRDLEATPRISLLYGLAFALLGAAISGAMLVWNQLYVVVPLAAGFWLVGPVAAVGLYEISRRRAAGEPPVLADALAAPRRNLAQIGLFAALLTLLLLFWVRLAMLVFALFFAEAPPSSDQIASLRLLVNEVLLSPSSIPFLIVGNGLGAALAALVFSITVVAIPMLLDRDANAFAAVATSMAAVRHNPLPMAIWAALIVLFIGAGMATFFIGLVFALPLVGHATWHAYKDVVAHQE